MHPFASTKASFQLILLCFLGGVFIPVSSTKDYWEAGLKTHNEYREVHNASLLELDTKLAEIADKCAHYYANTQKIDHSCPERNAAKAGENIIFSSDTSLDGVEAVKTAIKRWYREIEHYDFKKHKSKGGVVAHFTQVVWKGSKKLGIGFFKSSNGIYVVGLYTPAGNNGRNKENVLPFSHAAVAEVIGIRSLKSSASVPSTRVRSQKGQGAIRLALVMSVGFVAGRF